MPAMIHKGAVTMETQEFAKILSRTSDRICSRILHEDIEWVDIAIEIENMRDLVRSQCPENLELFERLYEARFRRFWEQWHGDVRPVQSEPSW
jgi:hypothetical protein